MSETGERVDWAREYREALAAVQAQGAEGSAGASGEPLVMAAPVTEFLDRVLQAANSDGGRLPMGGGAPEASSSDPAAVKKRLASIGKQLAPVLNASKTSKSHQKQSTVASSRIGHLQLDLIAKMAAFGGAKSKSAKKHARSEVRGLLDRIALLLDAASPPSIAGEDEHSPFQVLLELILKPRFEKPLPSLVRYLLRMYELLDEAPLPASSVLSDGILPLATERKESTETKSPPVPSSTLLSPPGKDAKPSILTALIEERSKKRQRDEANEAFKEMVIPAELRRKQKHRHPGNSERHPSSSSSSSTSKHRKTSHSRSGMCGSAGDVETKSHPAESSRRRPTKQESLAETSIRSELLRAGEKKSPRNPVTLYPAVIPRRTSVSGPNSRRPASAGVLTTRGSSLLQAHSSQQLLTRSSTVGHAPTIRQPLLGNSTKVTTSTSASVAVSRVQVDALRQSVVMRTPDRPKRQQLRAAASSASGRVLVAASPPLRRPSATSQQQRVLPLLGGSAERRRHSRAPPPPLFK